MKNYVKKGDTLTLAAPYDVSSGGGCQIRLIFGIAGGDAESGDDVDLDTVGVFDLAKVSIETFAVGAAVYWDDTTKLATCDDDSGGNMQVGVAVLSAANPSAAVRVKLG
jgi:predicted RecA/RadA family phage recombinase